MVAPKGFCNYCQRTTRYPCLTNREADTICGVTSDFQETHDKAHAKTLGYKEENVYQPNHYAKWPVEPITFILQNDLPYGVGNVIKYVMRYKDKNGLEDLLKAKRYIDLIIENEYPDYKG